MTGGGARAAYQVGALRGLVQILGDGKPFAVITGSSAGAINGMCLAVGADDFPGSVRKLEQIWLSLTPEQIYRTDVPSLFGIGVRWLGALTGGGAFKNEPINHLLDTSPLRSLLKHKIDFDRLPEQLRKGALRAVALSATNYQTGTAITFFESSVPIEPWARSTRLGRPEMLTAEHVMASSAMPLFFPPVPLGGAFYGDGCIRLTAPLSPAIHLGADRVVAISVRHIRTSAKTADDNEQAQLPDLTLAEISGALMNSVFLDSVESDIERLERINRTLSLIPSHRLKDVPHGLRPIPALVLRPSVDLATLASQQHSRFPAALRYLLSGLGVGVDRGTDLLSYLAFERDYVQKLVDLGAQDTLNRAEEIKEFLA